MSRTYWTEFFGLHAHTHDKETWGTVGFFVCMGDAGWRSYCDGVEAKQAEMGSDRSRKGKRDYLAERDAWNRWTLHVQRIRNELKTAGWTPPRKGSDGGSET